MDVIVLERDRLRTDNPKFQLGTLLKSDMNEYSNTSHVVSTRSKFSDDVVIMLQKLVLLSDLCSSDAKLSPNVVTALKETQT